MDPMTGDVLFVDCPARLAIEIIADKWSVVVVFALSQQPCRHSELVDRIGGISRKVLTQTLRKLQGYGLVEHQSSTTTPTLSKYQLTELGRTLIEPIEVLTEWARMHGEAVADFQESEQARPLGEQR
ncbi:helix-turn-helix transcriptional regulator [Rhodococcus sp. KBS0724]|uniref:winged helix-turn-helix transcriptional regulator n=1 Tax=Rhodococcus sp. KBS0724 TaxID=1179674 RepID=UPI00110ED43D|nr:helix-turn-helix domain-containing protein [Rhodococcus sp. KBS0724]TSD47848.1 helix-turn-helix transcriptional regulator [Rhodococcus sp. KBS0724]